MSHGFTLVEMLIVIAIIGILIAALIFNSQGVMKRGRLTAAQNHSHQVSLAVAQWLSISPTRQADSLNNLNCADATTLTSSGTASGYTSGALGWDNPKVTTMTCTIQATGRSVNVITQTDGKTFKNGTPQ